MKKKLLKISNGKFYVQDNMTFKEKRDSICNFHIEEITIYTKANLTLAFDITLKNNEKETQTCYFPISYLNDPLSWLYLGFDSNDFYITSPKKEFESSMIEIINLMRKHNKLDTCEINYGWELKDIDTKDNLSFKKMYFFGDFENPGDIVDTKAIKSPRNILFEHMTLLDMDVSAPLVCFMLLSLMTSLDILGKNIKPKFNIAIVGGTAALRRKIALFYTNLYKRDPSFNSNEYEMFHINKKDTVADIRLKAALSKDCVLIAFEPDKRHLNVLLKEIYRTNVLDSERTAPNLLLYTTEEYEQISENTIVVQLNDKHNADAIEKYFNINRIKAEFSVDDEILDMDRDYFKENIYYYIKKLEKKLNKNLDYIQKKFKEHHERYCNIIPPSVSETAWEANELLMFGFNMYSKFFEIDNAFKINVANSIYKVTTDSFPLKTIPTTSDIENAKNVCRQIDCYFEQKINQSLIGQIGGETNPSEKSVWYDEDTIYMTLHRAREFLKLTNSNLSFSISDRKALAHAGFIKSYTKKDSKPEYTVHIQKALQAKTMSKDDTNTNASIKTRNRYIAFNRDICSQHNLFPNIEKIIADRYIFDVARKKAREIKIKKD